MVSGERGGRSLFENVLEFRRLLEYGFGEGAERDDLLLVGPRPVNQRGKKPLASAGAAQRGIDVSVLNDHHAIARDAVRHLGKALTFELEAERAAVAVAIVSNCWQVHT